MIETLTRDRSYRRRYQRVLDFVWRAIVFINRYAYALSDDDILPGCYLEQVRLGDSQVRVEPVPETAASSSSVVLEGVFCPQCGFPVRSYRQWAAHGCLEPRGAIEMQAWE